jgi:hypothetical protein
VTDGIFTLCETVVSEDAGAVTGHRSGGGGWPASSTSVMVTTGRAEQSDGHRRALRSAAAG